MLSTAYDLPVSPVAIARASDEIFRASGQFERKDVDALYVDLDSAVERGRINTVLKWVGKSSDLGIQLFVVGSRQNLLSLPITDETPVTLIEKPLNAPGLSDEGLMEWLKQELEMIYAPLLSTGSGFIAMTQGEDSHLKRLAELARSGSPRNIDSRYLGQFMTDEEHEMFLDFLKRPASESNPESDRA